MALDPLAQCGIEGHEQDPPRAEDNDESVEHAASLVLMRLRH
jgi:hypothetical protein